MKKTAIEEFFLDNSDFMENISLSKEYMELLGKNDSIYKKLTNTLNEEQKELLDKLIDNHMGLESEASEGYLTIGIKAGLRLLAESLS